MTRSSKVKRSVKDSASITNEQPKRVYFLLDTDNLNVTKRRQYNDSTIFKINSEQVTTLVLSISRTDHKIFVMRKKQNVFLVKSPVNNVTCWTRREILQQQTAEIMKITK